SRRFGRVAAVGWLLNSTIADSAPNTDPFVVFSPPRPPPLPCWYRYPPVDIIMRRVASFGHHLISPRAGILSPSADVLPRHHMARLEDLTRGAAVKGVLPDGLVTVVDVKWHGSTVVELTYRDAAGRLGSELLYRDREPTL